MTKKKKKEKEKKEKKKKTNLLPSSRFQYFVTHPLLSSHYGLGRM